MFIKGVPVPFLRGFLLTFYMVLLSKSEDVAAQPYKQQQHCSSRLENALEHMRRRSIQVKSARSFSGETPYTLYNSFYGQHSEPEDDFYSAGGDRGYYAKHIQRNPSRPFQNDGTAGAGVNGGGGGVLEDLFTTGYNQRQPHKLAAVSSVDVEDLRVRLPSKSATARWVEVDKCKFSTENSTLVTRLIFPDLTLSGKVVLQPTGGKCHMILRLRHAGIEFRTIPIGFESAVNEESRRIGAASVRTDSHFAEPGFISVFAHGCQGPTGVRLRQNSKRRFGFAGDTTQSTPPDIELSEPQVILGTASSAGSGTNNRWKKYYNPYLYDIRTERYPQQNRRRWQVNDEPPAEDVYYDAGAGQNYYQRPMYRNKRDVHSDQGPFGQQARNDELNFDDDVLNVADDLQDLVAPDARAFADMLGEMDNERDDYQRHNVRDRNDAGDAFTNELEKIFSMGVRGLLTTYMQRALQPAIKETLMENMGYTLSYG